MIKGMSGFGQSTAENNRFKVSVQVRSVNHRYLDCSVYLPESLRSLEVQIKAIVKKKIKRGKVNVSFDILDRGAAGPNLNPAAVSAYIRLAKRLNKEFGLSSDISFSQLISLPQVLGQRQAILFKGPALKRLIITPLARAVEGIVKMRRKEGVAIYIDLKNRAMLIKKKLRYIEQCLSKILKRMGKKLSGEELSSFVRGCDVSEELVRLKFHLTNLYQTAFTADQEPKGKELDFITQELQRETNTLGAKVPDKNVSYAVVKIKSQLEKIREQLQNVE